MQPKSPHWLLAALSRCGVAVERKVGKKGWGLVITSLGPALKRYFNWSCSLFGCGRRVQRSDLKENSFIPLLDLFIDLVLKQVRLLNAIKCNIFCLVFLSHLLFHNLRATTSAHDQHAVKHCRGAWQGTHRNKWHECPPSLRCMWPLIWTSAQSSYLTRVQTLHTHGQNNHVSEVSRQLTAAAGCPVTR